MTREEKAKELIGNFRKILDNDFPRNKEDARYNFLAQCNAILCAKEVILQWEYIDTYLANLGGELNPNLRYWQEVKAELEKL